MTTFKDLPNILETSPETAATPHVEEAAFGMGMRPVQQDDNGMERVVCRVFGEAGKPALVDLQSRSVFPVKV